MRHLTSIKNILYSTIHRNKKTIEQIADEIGISANSLYRYGLEGESGTEIPLSRLYPLMKATNNYELLKHLAYLSGYVCIRIPRVSMNKKDEIDLIDDYQDATILSVKLLKEFFKNPNQDTFNNAKDSLAKVMEYCASNTKYVEKKITGQLEMEL